MSLGSRETEFILEKASGAKGQGCWKNSGDSARQAEVGEVFILFGNEAVDTEVLAGSCSKRHWEATRLSEGGGLRCGLDLGGEDAVGTLAGATSTRRRYGDPLTPVCLGLFPFESSISTKSFIPGQP